MRLSPSDPADSVLCSPSVPSVSDTKCGSSLSLSVMGSVAVPACSQWSACAAICCCLLYSSRYCRCRYSRYSCALLSAWLFLLRSSRADSCRSRCGVYRLTMFAMNLARTVATALALSVNCLVAATRSRYASSACCTAAFTGVVLAIAVTARCIRCERLDMTAMCGCTALVAHNRGCFRLPAVMAAAHHRCSGRHIVVCSRSHTAITSMLHRYPTLGMQMMLCAFARHVSSRCCVSHVRNSRHWLCRPAYMFRFRQRSTLKLPRSSSRACRRLQLGGSQ